MINTDIQINAEENHLVSIETINKIEFFAKCENPRENAYANLLLEKIKEHVYSSCDPQDVNDEKNRKQIASLAYNLSRTKTYIDGHGKELTSEYKRIPKIIDANRKFIRDELDRMQEELRAPLDAALKKEAEEALKLKIEQEIAEIWEFAHFTNAQISEERKKQAEEAEKLRLEEAERHRKEGEERAEKRRLADIAAEKARIENERLANIEIAHARVDFENGITEREQTKKEKAHINKIDGEVFESLRNAIKAFPDGAATYSTTESGLADFIFKAVKSNRIRNVRIVY